MRTKVFLLFDSSWHVIWLLVVAFLSACALPPSDGSITGERDDNVTPVVSSECSFVETVEMEMPTDAGYATAMEALDGLRQENYLPGVLVIEAKTEDSFIWRLFDGDMPLGGVSAVRNPNGLWQINQASWCIQEDSSGNTQNAQGIVKPLDCSVIEAADLADIVQNSGYKTPQQALNSLTLTQKPPGEIQSLVAYGDGVANYVNWLFLDGNDQTGSVTAARAAWGLWVITGVQTCLE